MELLVLMGETDPVLMKLQPNVVIANLVILSTDHVVIIKCYTWSLVTSHGYEGEDVRKLVYNCMLIACEG